MYNNLVSVKWGKEKLTANINTNETPDVFKMQLFSLTNVLPEKQKVMIKGKVLKDDWSGFKLKNVSFQQNICFIK